MHGAKPRGRRPERTFSYVRIGGHEDDKARRKKCLGRNVIIDG